MNKLDMELHDYLNDNITSITDEWLKTRKLEAGSIYSVDTNKQIEQMLRVQNTLTNKTMISALLNDQKVLDNYIEEWAHIISKSRINSNTPTHEVINALNNAQEIFNTFVITFIHAHHERIEKDDIIHWHTIFNRAFSRLTARFTEMHYTFSRQLLSSQQDLINELSTPIIPISEKIAILPLNGNVDTVRMKLIYDTVPEKVVDSHVEQLIIDLSGIPVIDVYIANQLWHLVHLLQLLGITPAISGVQPEVAQSFIQHQQDFKEVPTYSTLKQALKTMAVGSKSIKKGNH